MASTADLVHAAVLHFQRQVPALANLKLVFNVELRGRGDVQVFRVELPGPAVRKGGGADARVTVEMPRSTFNELAEEGTVRSYRRAYEQGDIKAEGDRRIQQLIGTVIAKQEARAGRKKVH